jgi:hypothetical protein
MIMITLRCTQKLQKYLGIFPVDLPEPSTAVLGDWCVNLIPTFSGDLIVFLSEKTLLTVAIPIWEANNLVPMFRKRVANLLGMIGVYPKDIANEIRHFDQVQYSKTANRSALGSLNDFAWHYQVLGEQARSKSDLSLSKAELKFSQIPCKPLDYRFPSEVAKELLSAKRKNAK